MKNEPKFILIHCSDVSYKTLYDQYKSINTYHRDVRGFPVSRLNSYVGYHVLLSGGKSYRCREDNEEGAHCNQIVDDISMNFQSLGVCVGFDGDLEQVPSFAYPLLQKQVFDWQDKYKIPNYRVKFHRNFQPAKTCPGSLITDEWLVGLLTRPTVKPKPSEQKEKARQIRALQGKISLLQRLIQLLTLKKSLGAVNMEQKLLSIRIKSFGLSLFATFLVAASGYVMSDAFQDLVRTEFGVTAFSAIALLVVRELAGHFRNKLELRKAAVLGRTDGEEVILL